jgi:hypothetical protein
VVCFWARACWSTPSRADPSCSCPASIKSGARQSATSHLGRIERSPGTPRKQCQFTCARATAAVFISTASSCAQPCCRCRTLFAVRSPSTTSSHALSYPDSFYASTTSGRLNDYLTNRSCAHEGTHMRLCSNDPDTQALIDYTEGPHRHRSFFDADSSFTEHRTPAPAARICQQCPALVSGVDRLVPRGGALHRPR